MLHINAKIRKTPFFLVDLFTPELYAATTIDDFLRCREDIKPTKKILPPAIEFYGQAIVGFDSFVYRRLSWDTVELSDLTAYLLVSLERFHKYYPERLSKLKDGMKLYEPYLVYDPKKQSLWLTSLYKTHGPAVRDRNTGREEIINRGLVLVPA